MLWFKVKRKRIQLILVKDIREMFNMAKRKKDTNVIVID